MDAITCTPPASERVAAIDVVGLTKRFGDVEAVSGASFRVPFGAVTGFIGANGSGKTTTMRMILDLTTPTSGSVAVDGVAYRSLANPRDTIGTVLSRLCAHPGLSAMQHLRIVAIGARLSFDRIEPLLESVGLADASDRAVGTFSTGMKQRLALAVALIGEPRILVLDEPASGLDPSGVRWLRDLLRARADAGAAVFVSTHQLAELSVIVDHVVVIEQGRIVANEPASQLLERTGETRLEDAVFSLDAPTAMAVGS